MKELKTVGDIVALSRFLLEAGCTCEQTIEGALARWTKLPVDVRAHLAQVHQEAVILFVGRDYPLAQDEWDHFLKCLAAELKTEPKLGSIRDCWLRLDSDSQAYLEGYYSLVIEVVEGKRLDPYGDPTVQTSRAVA